MDRGRILLWKGQLPLLAVACIGTLATHHCAIVMFCASAQFSGQIIVRSRVEWQRRKDILSGDFLYGIPVPDGTKAPRIPFIHSLMGPLFFFDGIAKCFGITCAWTQPSWHLYGTRVCRFYAPMCNNTTYVWNRKMFEKIEVHRCTYASKCLLEFPKFSS